MAMDQKQAELVLGDLIKNVKKMFYKDGDFKIADLPVVATVVVNDQTHPDAVPTVTENGIGLEVTRGLIQLKDDNAIKFALAHELGHGFSLTVLTRCGLTGASGEVTEVVADLGAAYLLANSGVAWEDILHTVDDWQNSHIFTPYKSGDHPPGDKRATCVHSLYTLIQSGYTFEDAVKGICMSFQDQ